MISLKSISSLNVLAVAVPREFAVEWGLPSDSIEVASDLPAAMSRLVGGNWCPELVVVYQGIPDQFAAADVETFVGQIPMTRCVVVFGPWCESIGRTEQVWPIGWCVPLQHAAVRLQQELADWQSDEPPLPPTASRDEGFVDSAVKTLLDSETLLSGRTVRVETGDEPFGLFLKEAVQALGGELVECDKQANVELLATTLVDELVVRSVAERRAANPDATLLVVTELATPTDVEKLTAAGCDGVLSQLRFVEQLAAAVQRPV